jgi:hypothetical protein
MKNKFIFPIAAICFSFIGVVNANQVINPGNDVTKTPIIHWVSYPAPAQHDHERDDVQISVDSDNYVLLLTADREYNGKANCTVDIMGCTSIAALKPGDVALCQPTSGSIFLGARCDNLGNDHAGVASGTVRYMKKNE